MNVAEVREWAGAHPVRGAAAARLAQLGFPGTRDEAWKYTRVSAFLEPAWRLQDGSGEAEPGGPSDPDAQIVFVDGRRTSGPLTPPLAGDASSAFDALNLAAARDGLRWETAEGRCEILHLATGVGALAAVRHHVRVSAGGRAVLVERFAGRGPTFTSAATVVDLAEGATLEHVRLVLEGDEVVHHGGITVHVTAGAHYRLVSIVLGGATVRIEPQIHLIGDGASVDLHGLVALRGQQHADHHVFVEHAAQRCTSRQAFRSLLGGRSRGVYTGAVHVRPGAIGTDSGQLHRALLLSEEAIANARPQLQIEADAVKCAHGAAIGTLDPDMLFYLQQRGLDVGQARALLTTGFVNETLAAIEDPAIRGRAEQAFGEWSRP